MLEIFILEIDKHLTTENYNEFMQMVSPEKRDRIIRFHNFDDSERTLLADVMIRKTISSRLGLRNDQIEFGVNEYNKPYLLTVPDFHYNISHSDRFVACAINDAPVGIDVEIFKPTDLKIAERFFSKEETAYILSQPDAEQLKAFYMTWTMKEAYIKYLGKGLSIPLNTFCVCDINIGVHFNCIFNYSDAACHVCSGFGEKPSVTYMSVGKLMAD